MVTSDDDNEPDDDFDPEISINNNATRATPVQRQPQGPRIAKTVMAKEGNGAGEVLQPSTSGGKTLEIQYRLNFNSSQILCSSEF